MAERGEVHRRPVLDQLALAHPEDVDELELDPISGRRQIPEFTKVCSPECLAGRNKIALSELLVDLHGGIRKPLQQRAIEGLEAARGPIRLRDSPTLRPVVIHELRVECLVSERQVVLILAPLHELSHSTLVVIARHPPPPAFGNKHAAPPVALARTPASLGRQVHQRSAPKRRSSSVPGPKEWPLADSLTSAIQWAPWPRSGAGGHVGGQDVVR